MARVGAGGSQAGAGAGAACGACGWGGSSGGGSKVGMILFVLDDCGSGEPSQAELGPGPRGS